MVRRRVAKKSEAGVAVYAVAKSSPGLQLSGEDGSPIICWSGARIWGWIIRRWKFITTRTR